MQRVLFAPRELAPLRPDAGSDLERYRRWQQDREAERLAHPPAPTSRRAPRISVLMVIDRPDPVWHEACLASIAAQTTTNWTLSVVEVGGSASGERRGITRRFPRRSVPVGTSTAVAMAVALDAGSDEICLILGQHDRLAPDALALLGAPMADDFQPPTDLVYGDEDFSDDEGDGNGAGCRPDLKPGWSPELLLSRPYFGRPVALRRSSVITAGGIRDLPGGAWEHDLFLRMSECTDRISHVAEVLCHRRPDVASDHALGSTSPSPDAGIAIREALHRRAESGRVVKGPVEGSLRIHRNPTPSARVSVIIPFRDQPGFLRTCVDSVLATAAGMDLELVLVDNGSCDPETVTLLEQLSEHPDITVLHDPQPFNWAALNNAAARVASGDVLVFLNNDIEARAEGWLRALVAQALRPEVGAVGARLLYPDGRVQHVGVVLGIGGAAGHVLCGLPAGTPGYEGMAVLARDCAAVTGACLATRREVFFELGGFDEDLGLDLNDIDYCLNAGAAGLRVIFEPCAELIHHESPSRGTSGSVDNIVRFIDRWKDLIEAGDPHLNSNLTRLDSSCALGSSDEKVWWRNWLKSLESS